MSEGTNMSRRELQVVDTLQLESIKNQLGSLLDNNPRELEKFKARMLKVATSYMLKDCTPESIIACGVQALTLNLPLEGGQGYIVNYGQVAQLDVGYKGWQMLAKRDGLSVLADPVYSCDGFKSSGFGFDAALELDPNMKERKRADDAWVKENIFGVIVSVREDATGLVVTRFVERDMLFKIIGMSPSVQSEKGRKYSPHENWADQMMCAKAIKQVVSKMPIDIAKATELHKAIHIVNETESAAQAKPHERMPPYSQEKFDTNWPAWVKLVETGKKRAVTIITQLNNGYSLTEDQTIRVNELYKYEPLDGDVSDADVVEG